MKKQSIITILFTILIVTNANTGESTRQPTSLKQLKSKINATQSPMTINDMYKVRGKVTQSQEQYKKAREAQYEQAQKYKEMLE